MRGRKRGHATRSALEADCATAKRQHADKHALAIVVVANKMITITWHMLKNKGLYDSRNESLYRRKLDCSVG